MGVPYGKNRTENFGKREGTSRYLKFKGPESSSSPRHTTVIKLSKIKDRIMKAATEEKIHHI